MWQQQYVKYPIIIADCSLNSTIAFSPNTPFRYHGSNTQLPLLISHSTQLSAIHQPLPSGMMAAILNHHCPFLTQLNCQPFTNHSPLVTWQRYSTTIADFSLNLAVIYSPL